MAVFVNSGRAEIARLVKETLDNDLKGSLLAFGAGDVWWGRPQLDQVTFDAQGVANLNHAPSLDKLVQVRSQDNAILFTTDDFILDGEGKITLVDGGDIADEATVNVSYTAHVPPPTKQTTALVSEVGRCRITAVDYVEPLEDAADPDARFVVVGEEKFAFSTMPTSRLLVRARLGESDAVGQDILEYGLFMGCEVDEALPDGQQFYEPNQVTGSGQLMIAQTRSPVPHDGTIGLDTTIVFEI